MKKSYLSILALFCALGAANPVHAEGTETVSLSLGTSATRITRGENTWVTGLVGTTNNQWSLPTAESVQATFNSSSVFAQSGGLYWGMCNGNNGNDSDFRDLSSTGFSFYGRQAYTGEYVAQVYDLTENVASVTVSFTFADATALSTSSFSVWRVSNSTAEMLAGSASDWAEGDHTFTAPSTSASTPALYTGERLVFIWNSNNAGKNVTISNFSASYTKAEDQTEPPTPVTPTAATAELQNGFYRIKYAGNNTDAAGKYLTAPVTLPTESTDDQNNYSVALSSGTSADESDMHTDVWYVENLGAADNTTEERYKIWCFRGGYGLATNPAPSVYGSYSTNYCPRLYRIMKVTAGDDVTYAFSGHPNDNVSGQSMGMAINAGAIGNKNYLSNTLNRGSGSSDATNSAVQWEFEAVDAESLQKSITIGNTGYATFSCYATTTIPTGVTAYEVTGADNSTVTLNPLSGTIPANTGVILEGTPATTYDFVPTNGLGKGMQAVNSDGTLGNKVCDGNKLAASVAATTLAAGDYILVNKGDDTAALGRIGEASGKELAAGKAYLPADAITAAEARDFLLFLQDGTQTGISDIVKATAKNGTYIEGKRVVILKNGVKYNTCGQRIK